MTVDPIKHEIYALVEIYSFLAPVIFVAFFVIYTVVEIYALLDFPSKKC